MKRISITYKLLETLFKPSLGDNYIIAIESHPFTARTIVAYFHGDEEKGEEQNMWKEYQKIALQEMRPYVPGEDLSGVSVSGEDTPELGGMIARNAENHDDQWYVAKDFFNANYEEV